MQRPVQPFADAPQPVLADGPQPAVALQPVDASAPAESAVAAVVDAVLNHPRHRELLYKALVYCGVERDERDVASYLAAQPEYVDALQGASVLVRSLVNHGGLAVEEVDADGAALDGERVALLRAQGATDDELADLAVARRVRTTPAGTAAVALLDPAARIAACCTAVPEREDAFLAILQLCEKGARLADIKALLARDYADRLASPVSGQRLEASFFIDRLNEAGALVWQDKTWVATEAGKRYLASL